jgi:anti-sigma factor RsiW
MTCADCLEQLGPFVDGELAADEAAQMREHLRDCADCAAAHRRLVDSSSQLKAGLMRYEAPDVLKARIRASLVETPGEVGALASRSLGWRAGWSRTVAAAAVVAIVSSALTLVATRDRTTANRLEEQVLASHIRSLIPGHLTDVASNDQHNVKPWFNGRVNMSPDVPRLDSVGYPLVGGRVDYIDGRNVAAVVYTRRQHVINVFSWPADAADLRPERFNSRGYNLIRASQNGEEVWIVSDLNLSELQNFTRLLIPPR